MAKENRPLQATYFSEPVKNTYYTLGVQFADYDSGHIKGLWGKGRFLGHSLGPSGYKRIDGGTFSEITFDLIFESLHLICADYSYDQLYGALYDKTTGEETRIVFNKAKDEVVSA